MAILNGLYPRKGDVVMNELAFMNAWLLILTVLLVITVIFMCRKLKEKERTINQMKMELRHVQRYLK